MRSNERMDKRRISSNQLQIRNTRSNYSRNLVYNELQSTYRVKDSNLNLPSPLLYYNAINHSFIIINNHYFIISTNFKSFEQQN